MTAATRFKFLIVNYIEQYTELAGEDLLTFAIAYASIILPPGRIHPAPQRHHLTTSCENSKNRTSVPHRPHARIL